MWDSLALPWQTCLEEAWTAYCAGSVPIGAVVTDARGHIIGRGRNRIMDKSASMVTPLPGDSRLSSIVFNHELAHAELNALLALGYSDWDAANDTDPHRWILYTTMEPCPLCLGAFYMSGLRQLHYAARDTYAGSVNLLGTTPYLSRKPIQVFGPLPELEPVSVALVVESMLQESTGERSQFLLDYWRKTIPLSVALGERLFDQQILQQLRAANASAPEMFTRVARAMQDDIQPI
jgi:tRNA(Arg) A34 adenosine deaminase TadA